MLDEGHRAFIYSNRTLRNEMLDVFDSTFAITYALELIAIAVAMLGVAGTLLTLVLERRRELSLLRLTGADRRQVRRMVIIEAALIGGGEPGHRPGGRLRAVDGVDLRDQRAELRLDDSVPHADCVPGPVVDRGRDRDGDRRHLSGAPRRTTGAVS